MCPMEIRRLRLIREGGGYLLGFWRMIASESVQGPRSGDAPVGSSAGEDADGGQCDSAISGVWSTHSIAFRTCTERRPEWRWRRCASVSRWLARSERNWAEQKKSGGVPEQGEGLEEERRCSITCRHRIRRERRRYRRFFQRGIILTLGSFRIYSSRNNREFKIVFNKAFK
jgi:hypothetical protein